MLLLLMIYLLNIYYFRVVVFGIEMLPIKSMQCEMSSGVAYYEDEVYDILRHQRNDPAVQLYIIGIAPK